VQNEDGSSRIGMIYEPNQLMANADKMIFIKNRRIAWVGHVMRMDDMSKRKKILDWKPIGTRIRGRPIKRWVADIEEDMQIIGIKDWTKKCKERSDWKRILRRLKPIGGFNISERRRKERRRRRRRRKCTSQSKVDEIFKLLRVSATECFLLRSWNSTAIPLHTLWATPGL